MRRQNKNNRQKRFAELLLTWQGERRQRPQLTRGGRAANSSPPLRLSFPFKTATVKAKSCEEPQEPRIKNTAYSTTHHPAMSIHRATTATAQNTIPIASSRLVLPHDYLFEEYLRYCSSKIGSYYMTQNSITKGQMH